LLTLIGVICGLSFMGKVILQYFLDSYALTENNKTDTFYRPRYFLPYYYEVPTKLINAKRVCNFLYYCTIITAVLFLIIRNY